MTGFDNVQASVILEGLAKDFEWALRTNDTLLLEEAGKGTKEFFVYCQEYFPQHVDQVNRILQSLEKVPMRIRTVASELYNLSTLFLKA